MHEQERARKIAKVNDLIQDLKDCPHLTSHMFHELSKRLGDPSELRSFSLRVMAAGSEEAKEFGAILGETSKMVRHPKLSEFSLPRRLA